MSKVEQLLRWLDDHPDFRCELARMAKFDPFTGRPVKGDTSLYSFRVRSSKHFLFESVTVTDEGWDAAISKGLEVAQREVAHSATVTDEFDDFDGAHDDDR